MEGIKIKTKYYPEDNDIVIVELGGYIDQTNCGQVQKVISDIVKDDKLNIIFDLSDLIYMSSAGWGIFIGEIKMVRDSGGDIKLSSMSPEVYDVFQMLEFFHIIEDYPTVQEAVESYLGDAARVITKKKEKEEPSTDDRSIEEILENSGVKSKFSIESSDEDIVIEDEKDQEISVEEEKPVAAEVKEEKPVETERQLNITQLPLPEKIKHIAASYPMLNIFQIRKMLHHEKFGSTKIGLIKLYMTLRYLNLESVSKRYRFYRSF